MLKKLFSRNKKQKVTTISKETVQKSLEKNKLFDDCYLRIRKKKPYTFINEEVFDKVNQLYNTNYCDIANYPFPIDFFEKPTKEGTINWDSNAMGWNKIITPYVRLVLAHKGIFVPTLEEMNEDK